MKIFDIAFKDLIHNFRNRFAIGMMFIAPLIISSLIYIAFSGQNGGNIELAAIKVAIVNLDKPVSGQPAVGQMMVAILQDPSVSKWLEASEFTDENSARAAVANQQVGAAVIIPPNLSQTAMTGQGKAQVVIIQDPTLTIGPSVVKEMIGSFLDGITGARISISVVNERLSAHGKPLDQQGIMALAARYQEWFTDFQRGMFHSPQAALVMRPPASAGQSSANSSNLLSQMMGPVFAGMMLFFAFFTGSYAMMSILQEDENGTLSRLFSTPTSRTAILAGKLFSVLLMVLVQSLVMIAIGTLAFRINWGAPLAITMNIIGQVAAASGLGVLLISFLKNSKQAGPVMGGGLTVLGMLGGLFSVSVKMPAGFDTLALFTPQGWAIHSWIITFAGASLSELLLPMVILLTMGIVMFIAGAAQFRRRYA
jgi:ABC-2 type transport system permease protein